MTDTVQSVQEQLDQFANDFAQKVPAEVREVMESAGQAVAESISQRKVLGVGDTAPGFELPNATGGVTQLKESLGQGPVVLTFYRGSWCPYCNIELRALQAALPELQALNASLIAVSPQTPDQSLSTAEKNELAFPVLSDVGNKVADEFGLVFTLPEELRPIYAEFGIDVPAHNGDETFELPVSATYVIAPDGRIAYAFVNPDYRRRAEPREILTVLEQLES